MTQPRQPVGAPDSAGGEYTEKLLTPPEVSVAESAHGSFLFPPRLYGANNSRDEFITYWESVPISDRVLSNLSYVYAERRARWAKEAIERWNVNRQDSAYLTWLHAKGRTDVEINDRYNLERAELVAKLAEERPVDISPLLARPVAISAQMVRFSGHLSEADRQSVLDHVVHTSHEGQTSTTLQLWDRFRLGEIADEALVDQDVSVRVEIEALREDLAARP